MRKAINENPIAQVVLIGALVIIVGVLFMTRIASQGGSDSPEATTTPAADAAGASVTVTPAATPPAGATSTATPPPTSPTPASAEFEAGRGLPAAVVDAYDDGKTVVLLVVRREGIDDRKVSAEVRRQAGNGDTVLFITRAKRIAKYSRITQGVDVDRVPAMVVIRPKRLSDGPMPEATVSYGYRGPQSIAQAVRDATYHGRDDVPYYPE